ncbi:hypothetical protein Lal_00039728 [Lupinus albus]|nr:hypothetical protein Lal_00039728 [Lupinus albus]
MTKIYWNITLEDMMEVGVHFGHGTRKWNPRISPYISPKRKGIHITNLTRIACFLSQACDLQVGETTINCGTKNKATDSVERVTIIARCHYVRKNWLGGMLTNWYTTEMRLDKLRDLRTEQNTGILDCLSKRDASMLKIYM